MGDTRDWHAWHAPYDVDGSPLNVRLEIVQRRIRQALDDAPGGPIRIVSACAGQGRDLLPVLADHPRAPDVRARLVELDPRNTDAAAAYAAEHGLARVDIVTGDASRTRAYVGSVPAHLVLFCGIWGNVTDADVESSLRALPMFCAPRAIVIWTRHRKAPDLTLSIRGWLADVGFEEVGFDAPDHLWVSVGTHRYIGPPVDFVPDHTLFTFLPEDTYTATR